jgi:peptide deformylase
MSVRDIVVYDDPQLRRKSRRVRRITPALERLIDDMLESMRAANGIGLAAIQVGVPERVIVLEVAEEPDELDEAGEGTAEDAERPLRQYIVINPEIARPSRDTEEGIEGCLSVPGLVGEVERHTAVTVKGLDVSGRKQRIKADGFLARVFQHEIDHCDGVLFIDHIDDPEKVWPVEEGQEEAVEATQQLPGEHRGLGGHTAPAGSVDTVLLE